MGTPAYLFNWVGALKKKKKKKKPIPSRRTTEGSVTGKGRLLHGSRRCPCGRADVDDDYGDLSFSLGRTQVSSPVSILI